jgi:hypothetical protein
MIRTGSALALFAFILLASGNAIGQSGPTKGNLHVFSAGISNARGQRYVPGPKQNAQASDAFWAAQGGKLYNEVFRHKLINEQATRKAFLSELDKVVEQAQAGDAAVIYLCGHGGFTENDPEWVFAVYDGFVTESELRDRVVKLARKGVRVMLLLDSCHSGAVEIREPNVIVIASCTKEQTALAASDDGENSLSLFTGVLLRGLSGAADLNKDGVITLAELNAYIASAIEEELKEIRTATGRPFTQEPTCGLPSNLPLGLPLVQVSRIGH